MNVEGNLKNIFKKIQNLKKNEKKRILKEFDLNNYGKRFKIELSIILKALFGPSVSHSIIMDRTRPQKILCTSHPAYKILNLTES